MFPRSQILPAAVVMLVLGGIFGVVGLALLVRAWRFGAQATRTTGTVVGMEDDHDGGLFPVIEFEGPAGTVRFSGRFSTGRSWTNGTRVPVLYSRADPRRAQIGTFAQRFGAVIIFLGAAALAGAMAEGVMLVSR
jgi:hypothetical protein